MKHDFDYKIDKDGLIIIFCKKCNFTTKQGKINKYDVKQVLEAIKK